MVEECMARARRLYKVSEDALTFKPGPHIMIQADADEVRAAVSNLIDNAVKYSGTNPRVRVETLTLDGNFVAVRVKDNGPGVPEAERKQIFKRFYRMPGPTATRVKGTGLGLFIVRSVAKRHGGKAWVESDGPGKGSTFVLQLPITR